jgi:2-haloalkanoic acid dehalogenase type II
MATGLKETKGLFFDVYATLIDWEAGILPQLLQLASTPETPELQKQLFHAYHEYQKEIWVSDPTLKYPLVLERVYARVARDLGVTLSQDAQQAFGRSIGEWPAFPDTVKALERLAKHYKLFVLSNVDNESFERTRRGPLQNAHWDGIYTAETIGSYKPDPRNYEYVVEQAAKFGIKKSELLIVAQSLEFDHVMTKKLNFKPGIWIARGGSTMGGHREELERDGLIDIAGAYDKLSDFADAVESAFS